MFHPFEYEHKSVHESEILKKGATNMALKGDDDNNN